MPGPTLPPSDDDAILRGLPISPASLPHGKSQPTRTRKPGMTLEASVFIDANTGKPFLEEGDVIVAVNGISTVSSGAAPITPQPSSVGGPAAEPVSVSGSPEFEQVRAQLMAAKAELEKVEASGDPEAIAVQQSIVHKLEVRRAEAAKGDATGAGRAVRITHWAPSTEQGLREIRRLTMPPHDGAPVSVAVKKKRTGRTIYVKARYIGPVPERNDNWDEDVRRWTAQLSEAGDMYREAVLAELPAIELAKEESTTLKRIFAVSKLGTPYSYEREVATQVPVMSATPEQKIATMTYSDADGEHHGKDAVEALKRQADKIFNTVSREIFTQVEARALDESLPPSARESAVHTLERLRGIAEKNPDAMSAIVRSKSVCAQLRRDAAEQDKKAAMLYDQGKDGSKAEERAKTLRAAADRLYNLDADKFDALIVLVVNANLARMGHGLKQYVPGTHGDPHQNTKTLAQLDAMTKPKFQSTTPSGIKFQTGRQAPSEPRAPGAPRPPSKSGGAGGGAPKRRKAGPSTPYTGPVPESREIWVNAMLFSILESKGVNAAIEFSKLSMVDVTEVLPKLSNGQVVLHGFGANEQFLNGLAGRIIEHNASGVIVRLIDSARVKSLLAEEDRTLRVAPNEIIIVGGTLR